MREVWLPNRSIAYVADTPSNVEVAVPQHLADADEWIAEAAEAQVELAVAPFVDGIPQQRRVVDRNLPAIAVVAESLIGGDRRAQIAAGEAEVETECIAQVRACTGTEAPHQAIAIFGNIQQRVELRGSAAARCIDGIEIDVEILCVVAGVQVALRARTYVAIQSHVLDPRRQRAWHAPTVALGLRHDVLGDLLHHVGAHLLADLLAHGLRHVGDTNCIGLGRIFGGTRIRVGRGFRLCVGDHRLGLLARHDALLHQRFEQVDDSVAHFFQRLLLGIGALRPRRCMHQQRQRDSRVAQALAGFHFDTILKVTGCGISMGGASCARCTRRRLASMA